MVAIFNPIQVAVTPSSEDTLLARESSAQLAHILTVKTERPLSVRITPPGESEQILQIPIAALRMLRVILMEMAKRNALTFIPIHAELTTQQTTDLLNVSRPFLIEQLEKGLIPHRLVGTHRRVLFQDILKYKRNIDNRRLRTLEELSALDQKIGLGC